MIEIRHLEAPTSIATRPAPHVRPAGLVYPNAKPTAKQTQAATA
ncbi:hypothetical protein [Arthrobacter sp. M2012083]|nr:hypothetical protein [Arthrobacter sp. M2012083]